MPQVNEFSWFKASTFFILIFMVCYVSLNYYISSSKYSKSLVNFNFLTFIL